MEKKTRIYFIHFEFQKLESRTESKIKLEIHYHGNETGKSTHNLFDSLYPVEKKVRPKIPWLCGTGRLIRRLCKKKCEPKKIRVNWSFHDFRHGDRDGRSRRWCGRRGREEGVDLPRDTLERQPLEHREVHRWGQGRGFPFALCETRNRQRNRCTNTRNKSVSKKTTSLNRWKFRNSKCNVKKNRSLEK